MLGCNWPRSKYKKQKRKTENTLLHLCVLCSTNLKIIKQKGNGIKITYFPTWSPAFPTTSTPQVQTKVRWANLCTPPLCQLRVQSLSAYGGVCHLERGGETDFQPSLVNVRVHSHSQPKVCTHSFTLSHPHPQDSACYFKDAEWKDVSAFAFYFHFCFKESSSRKTVGWKSHLKLRLRHNEWAKVSCSVSTLCDPMDCSSPGSSVQGISQARILERVAISFSRGSSQPRDWTRVCCTAGGFFATEPPPPALSDLKEITK